MTTQNENPETSNKTLLRVSAPDWSLKANDNGMDGQIFPILSEQFVGREDCEILLTSPHSSRRHARLNISNGVLQVEDLDSANGTYVNGEKIVTAILKDGDIVRFDMQEFTVVGPKEVAKTMVRPAADPEQPAQKSPPKKVAVKKTPRKKAAPKKKPRKKAAPKKKPVIDLPLVEAPPIAPSSIQDPLDEKQMNVDDLAEKSTDEAVNLNKTLQATSMAASSDLAAQLDDGAARVISAADRLGIPRLVGTTGVWADKVIELSGEAMTIGRIGVDIPLDDPSVSTKHAQIIMQENKWKIVDLMSANGVFVNGKKTQASFLDSGDMIRFGRLELCFMINDAGTVPIEALGKEHNEEEQNEEEQKAANTRQKIGYKVPGWLYVAIGFAVVLAIGTYVLSSN